MIVAAQAFVTSHGDLVLAVVRRSGQSTDVDLHLFQPADETLLPIFSAGGLGPPGITVHATATVIHAEADGETEYSVRATATFAETWNVDVREVD